MRREALLLLIPAAAMMFHLVSLGPMAIDDAYISYRYAANLADGHGLVFNEGERVQGFTNPLYTLLLGLAGVLGIDIPRAAIALGMLGALGVAAVLIFFPRGTAGRVAGLLAAVGLMMTPEFVLNALSGMETMLFCALMLGTAWAFDRKRPRLAGVLAGLLLMTRADAIVFLLPPALFLLVRHPRELRTAALPAAVVWGAWLVFAWAYYGNPVPHSLAAKRLIHRGDFVPVLMRHLHYLSGSSGLRVVWVLAAIGLVVELRRMSRIAVIGLGAVLYLLGLAASGIMPFEVPRYFLWYSVPLIPVRFLLMARAAVLAAGWLKTKMSAPAAAGFVAAVPAVLALASYLGFRENELAGIRGHFAFRERGYEQVAMAIREEVGTRTTDVLVGEVGVVGYHLLGHRVHDSSGINSPKILRFRTEDRDSLAAQGVKPPALDEGSPRWVLRFLRDERPEYVTTVRLFLYLHVLEGIPAFNAIYEPVAQDRVWLGEGMVQHALYGSRDRDRRGR